MERRRNKKSVGRRRDDMSMVALGQFKDEMREHVTDTIIKVVNGKLDKLDVKISARLDAQDEAMRPVIEALNGFKWGKNFLLAVMGFIAAVGGLYLMAIKIFKE